MSRGKRVPVYLFIIVLVFFIIGLYNLFSLRFRIGDIYPSYSSLRSDPLGTKVFFKSLAGLDNLDVERNFQSMSKFMGDRHTTLFVLGITGYWMEMADPDIYRALSGLAASGGRLVISLYPSKKASEPVSAEDKKDQEEDKTHEDPGNNKQDKGDLKDKKASESLSERWGLSIAPSEEQGVFSADLNLRPGHEDLPSSIKCTFTQYFTELDDEWDVIYARKGLPVIIERKFGAGSIVLCADSFLFSNEAMMSERYPGLLAWLVSQGVKIHFDESHFGIQKTLGITDLTHKYGLQGVLLVLLLIAGLVIWKTATHFVPPFDGNGTKEAEIRTERDHLDGLVGLLKRNIPPKALLKTCVEEWEKTFIGDRDFLRARIEKVRELIEASDTQADPVQSYKTIYDKISERNRL